MRNWTATYKRVVYSWCSTFPPPIFFFVTHAKQDSSSPLHCSLLSQGDQQLPSCQTNGQFWLYFTFSLLLLASLSSLKYYLYLDSQTPQFSKFSSAVISLLINSFCFLLCNSKYKLPLGNLTHSYGFIYNIYPDNF